MSDGKPGEDLGIGWGVAEDRQTAAMGVNDARDWQETTDVEATDEPAAGEAEGAVDEGDDTQDGADDDRG